jgi:hypothetical protein
MHNDAIMRLPRNERRLILGKEERLRKSGNWPAWETITFPKGSVSPNPKGWAFQFETAHRNEVFSVLDRTLPNGVRHLAVSSLSGIRPTWWEMQRIKDEIAGEAATAVEVYPPHREIIDGADMFHIFVLPERLPFSLWEDC